VEEPRSVSLIEIIASTKLIGHNEFSQSVKGSNRFWKKNELEFQIVFTMAGVVKQWLHECAYRKIFQYNRSSVL